MDSVRDVVVAIENAFADVLPGTVTIHEAMVIDDYGDADQRRDARKLDPERDWRQVTGAVLQECSSAMPFFDPLGWRFYLPAYICCGLRESKTSLIDRAIDSLIPRRDPRFAAYQLRRFRVLNRLQIDAVRRFLEFVASDSHRGPDSPAGEALEAYWACAGLSLPSQPGKAVDSDRTNEQSRRHLHPGFFIATLNRGRAIECLIGPGEMVDDNPTVRWASIRKTGEQFVARLYVAWDPRNPSFLDIYSFPASSGEPADPVCEEAYAEFDLALECVRAWGGDPARFVNEGLVRDEYGAYLGRIG